MQGHSNGFKEDFKRVMELTYHVVFGPGMKRLETCIVEKEYMEQSHFNLYIIRSDY